MTNTSIGPITVEEAIQRAHYNYNNEGMWWDKSEFKRPYDPGYGVTTHSMMCYSSPHTTYIGSPMYMPDTMCMAT